jgi:hypothetical protein
MNTQTIKNKAVDEMYSDAKDGVIGYAAKANEYSSRAIEFGKEHKVPLLAGATLIALAGAAAAAGTPEHLIPVIAWDPHAGWYETAKHIVITDSDYHWFSLPGEGLYWNLRDGGIFTLYGNQIAHV